MRRIYSGLLVVALLGVLAGAWGMQARAARPGLAPQVRPAFGTDIRISTDNPGQPHSDVVGAADPLNPLHFVVGATDANTPTTSLTGAYFTTDGGQTWGGGNLLGPYPPALVVVPSGEVRVGIDRFNNSFVVDRGLSAGGYCPGGMYSHRSTNGGATFLAPVQIVTNSQTEIAEGLALSINQEPSGTWAGRLYAAYGAVAATNCVPSSTGPSVIRLRYSSDNGDSWSAPTSLTQPQDPVFQRVLSQFPAVAAAVNGRLYVGYVALTSLLNPTTSARIYVNRSIDGGTTFGSFVATTGSNLTLPGYVDATSFGDYVKADTAGHGLIISPAPVLAANGLTAVYAAWTHHQTGWDTTYQAACCGGGTTQRTFQAADIAFVRSTDGGNTWSAPVRVNDDPLNNGKDQFTPALSLNPDGTTLYLSWYDRRDDPNNLLYHRYYSYSTDDGVTWSANQQVSDAPSDPAQVLGADGNAYIGLYSGLAANIAQRILPFWVDTRAGTPPGEQRLYTDANIGGNPTATPTATTPPGATGTPTPPPGATGTPTTAATATPSPSPTLTCGPSWNIVTSPNVSPNINELLAVDALSGTDVWAVGQYHGSGERQPQTMHWNGSQWTSVPVPTVVGASSGLNAVAAISANDVWAVGGISPSTLALHWNGSAWSVVPSPSVGNSGSVLLGLTAVAANDVWAVGSYQEFNGATLIARTLIEHWNGTAWAVVPSPNVGADGNTLNAVAAVAANDIWAVGYSSGASWQTLIEHWNGSAWSVVPSPNVGSAGNELTGLAVVSATDMWAVGYSTAATRELLILHWNGIAWTVGPSLGTGQFMAVVAASAGDVWAVGHFFNGNTAQTRTAHWNGQTWTLVSSPNPEPEYNLLYGVSVADAAGVWAVGTKRQISSLTGQTLALRYADPCLTPCPIQFNDVPSGSTFYAYVRCLACRGIVGGYPCGGPAEPCPGAYYRPNTNVTRGQTAKIVSESAALSDPVPSTQQTFEDVPPTGTFWLWVERLSGRGIIGGYPCGGPFEPCVAPGNRPYFRPNNQVTRGQLSKIVSGAAGYSETPTTQTFEDVPPGSTFYIYVGRVASRGIVGGYPCGGGGEPCVAPGNRPYFRPNNNATRGQMAKIAASAFFPGCQTPQRR